MIKTAKIEDSITVTKLAFSLWPDHIFDELKNEMEETLLDKNAMIALSFNDNTPIGFAQCQLRHDYVDGTESSPVGYLEGIFVGDSLQRQYLDYIWHRKDGIYYLANFPLTEKPKLEDKRFYLWLYTLEYMSGFSLFPEFMKDEAFPHLLNETYRLINDDVAIPVSYKIRYAESCRNKNKRKNDIILRILRLLVKC